MAEGRDGAPLRVDGRRSKKLTEHPELIESLWLVKNGVPYDVAFSLSAPERFAYVVIFGGFEGNDFCWNELRWKKS